MQVTIDPRVTDDNGALWQLQFRKLSLDALILQGDSFNIDQLIPIRIAVNIRAESKIALDFTYTQVDYGLVELTLYLMSGTCT